MKKVSTILAGLLVLPVLAFGATVAVAQTASAAPSKDDDLTLEAGVGAAKGADVPESISGDDGLVTKIINILLWAIGVVSVIMLIIGGFRYATSNGDSNQVTAAKNTIMYAVIGLVIAIFAYAIVNFVLFQTAGIDASA